MFDDELFRYNDIEVKDMKTMLDYINEIPEYITSHINEGDYVKLREDFINEHKSTISIIACGSSNNASNCAYHYLQDKLNVKVNIYTPYTFANYEHIDKDSFYLVISQSGRSVNTLAVIDKLKKENVLVHFLTDNKDIKDEELINVYQLDIGNEEVPFVTKGMSSTVFFLLRFASDDFIDLDTFNNLFKQYQQKAIDYFNENKNLLINIKRVHILGSGSSKGVASEGSLKFCETLHVGASGYEIEEFLHGGNFELQKDHEVIMINSKFDEVRVNQLKNNLSILCDNYYVLDKTGMDESISSLIYLAFFQTLVYLINKEKGNNIPLMEDKYLEFESHLKAKTINFYE